MSPGVVIVGGVVSRTSTEKLPEEVLPTESDALQLTLVVPSENIEPEAGEQDTAPAPCGSDALALKLTAALVVSSTSRTSGDAGSDRVGPVVSTDQLTESVPGVGSSFVAWTTSE